MLPKSSHYSYIVTERTTNTVSDQLQDLSIFLPRFLQTIGSQKSVKLSALRAGRPLPPQEDPWHSFLLEVESTPGP
jgi:hypothetical protein